MGLFGSKSEGGFMDVIRCDEPEYLVWKWRPSGEANSTKKENAIRYGSSLRVKEGELAVFVYNQNNGPNQDFILGPFDQTIKTANFPILTSIVGSAFGGASPFQAEIYFINLAGNVPIKFGVPYFNITDRRLPDFPVPMSVRGQLIFNITDYERFIKNTRLIEFNLDSFKELIRSAMQSSIKSTVLQINRNNPLNLVQIEENLDFINETLKAKMLEMFNEDFSVNLKRFDIDTLDIDQESEGYARLLAVTRDQQQKTLEAQTDVNVQNLQDMQQLNAMNMEETLRIQREEAQRAQKLQTETNFMGTHQLNQQTEVLKSAANSLGDMGAGGGNGGLNPAGMMTGMMMGGAMGGQMANMMNQMGNQVQNAQNMPPPPPQLAYNISINGQNSGPFNLGQLQQMVQSGQINQNTYVWKQGMAGWELAGNVAELSILFAPAPPPPPPPPAP
ncbi:MAG: SPFH domain-containing protein [Crocinitomicaceae bacterium]